jgi:UDP-N-acetylglucosamine/UDP-N-acetylgalactosamine diphosphorylase
MPKQKLLNDLEKVLRPFDHLHLLQDAFPLTVQELEQFCASLSKYGQDFLLQQRQAITAPLKKNDLSPWLEITAASALDQGKTAISHGKVASVILAGGQGTRLGWPGPKALFPILPEKNLTLLQILLQKVFQASQACGKALPVAIMASPLNEQAIRDDLEKNACGLEREQSTLFVQEMAPLLDEQSQWFLERPGQICLGPNGNGRVFHHLQEKGILERWKKRGIEYITIISIDNPLGEPFDPQQIGHLVQANGDVVVKCVERIDPQEQVGLFAHRQGRLHVVEYSEIAEAEKQALDSQGRLAWPYANIGQFAFPLEFIEKSASIPLPWHIAKKRANAWGRGEIAVAKCETFLFDVLPYAANPKVLLCSREDCYAPLKNATGDKSPETVRLALQKLGHSVN